MRSLFYRSNKTENEFSLKYLISVIELNSDAVDSKSQHRIGINYHLPTSSNNYFIKFKQINVNNYWFLPKWKIEEKGNGCLVDFCTLLSTNEI